MYGGRLWREDLSSSEIGGQPHPIRLAYHEAGHAVAAWSHGITIFQLDLEDRGDGNLGGCAISTDPLLPAHAVVFYGGPIAEQLATGAYWLGAEGIERQCIQELLGSTTLPLASDEFYREARQRALDVLARNWDRVERLAYRLLTGPAVGSRELEVLLGPSPLTPIP